MLVGVKVLTWKFPPSGVPSAAKRRPRIEVFWSSAQTATKRPDASRATDEFC